MLGLILVIIAALLAVVHMAVRPPVSWLLPVALLLVCLALVIGVHHPALGL